MRSWGEHRAVGDDAREGPALRSGREHCPAADTPRRQMLTWLSRPRVRAATLTGVRRHGDAGETDAEDGSRSDKRTVEPGKFTCRFAGSSCCITLRRCEEPRADRVFRMYGSSASNPRRCPGRPGKTSGPREGRGMGTGFEEQERVALQRMLRHVSEDAALLPASSRYARSAEMYCEAIACALSQLASRLPPLPSGEQH